MLHTQCEYIGCTGKVATWIADDMKKNGEKVVCTRHNKKYQEVMKRVRL